MRNVYICIILIYCFCCASGEDTTSISLFFLSDDYYDRYAWFTDLSSTLKKLDVNVSFKQSVNPHLAWLSYKGAVNKAYSNSRPLKEMHNLLITKENAHLSLGAKASFGMSIFHDNSKEEAWNFYPADEQDEFYSRSISRFINNERYTYGLDGNCRAGGHGAFVTLMAGGTLISQRGYAIEKDMTYNKNAEISVHDYQPQDISYEFNAGVKVTKEIKLACMYYVSFADFSVMYGQDRNKLRVPPELYGIRTSARPADLQITGDRCNRWTTQFSIGFQPIDEVTYVKQLIVNGTDNSNKVTINSFKFSVFSRKEDYSLYRYTHKSSSGYETLDTLTSQSKFIRFSNTVVPEVFIIKPVSFQIPIVVQSEAKDLNSKVQTGSITGVIHFRALLKDDFFIDAAVSSGELAVNLDKEHNDVLPIFHYRAYTAFLRIRFAKLF